MKWLWAQSKPCHLDLNSVLCHLTSSVTVDELFNPSCASISSSKQTGIITVPTLQDCWHAEKETLEMVD